MPEESARYLFDEVTEIPLSNSWRNEVFIFVWWYCWAKEYLVKSIEELL